MKVYAVSSGSYSDYGVHALFVNEDDASAVADLAESTSGWGDYFVEEFEMYDEAVIPKTEYYVSREVDAKTGEMSEPEGGTSLTWP